MPKSANECCDCGGDFWCAGAASPPFSRTTGGSCALVDGDARPPQAAAPGSLAGWGALGVQWLWMREGLMRQ